MNYRHAFHAGNFADLVKHAVLLQLLSRAGADASARTVIDTHAGQGIYDLAGPEAQRSGEAAAGVLRLMSAADAPTEFEPLLAAVRRLNSGATVTRYPGSPWLVADVLRQKDRLIACELRPPEHAALAAALRGRRGVEALCADGYLTAVDRCPAKGQVLVLIDPPFERADDYDQVVRASAALREQNAGAQVLVWLPLKDLETFDAFLRDLEDEVEAPILVAETRMRPLADPLRMNGCALVLIGADGALQPMFEAVCGWTANTLGEGGGARVYLL